METKMITVRMDSLTWNLVRDMLVVGRDSWQQQCNESKPGSLRYDIAMAYVLRVETAILALDEADLLGRAMADIDPSSH